MPFKYPTPLCPVDLAVENTHTDFTMIHNACIPVCALIHLLSSLPALPYTGLVGIIKSDSFFIPFFCSFFSHLALICSLALQSVSDIDFLSLKTCISFHNNVDRISTAWRGFPLMCLWSAVWTQMRGPRSPLNLAPITAASGGRGGVGGRTPSPLVTCLLPRYTAAHILQPPQVVDSLDKDSFLSNQIVVIASLRIPNWLIINKRS